MRKVMLNSIRPYLCAIAAVTFLQISAKAGEPVRSPAFALVTGEPKLHCLIVLDTDDGTIGNLTGKNNEWLQQTLLKEVEKNHRLGQVRVLQGTEVHPLGILSAISSLPVNAQDSLLCHFSCHGGVRPDGHYLVLSHPSRLPDGSSYGSELARRRIQLEMAAQHPQAAILLTDCCSTQLRVEQMPTTAPPSDPWPLILRLFFDLRGIVDVTAARPRKEAYYHTLVDGGGGLFTEAFSKLLYKEHLNLPSDAFSAWNQFLNEMDKKTSDWTSELESGPQRCWRLYLGSWIPTWFQIETLCRVQFHGVRRVRVLRCARGNCLPGRLLFRPRSVTP